MIVFSAHADLDWPSDFLAWIDSWVFRRSGSPGALVALIGGPADSRTGLTDRHLHLRDVAKRAGMDFLPHGMLPLPNAVFNSIDSVRKRAETETAFLRRIVDNPHYSPHWGIDG